MWMPQPHPHPGGPSCECGPGAVPWIQNWFSDCVATPWEMIGFAVGLSSVLFWLVAQLPQFIRNIRLQSAEALSPWFLFQWLTGDTLNLLGCILTGDQLASETFTACYFIFADCCIISQYVYYQLRKSDVYQLTVDDSIAVENATAIECFHSLKDKRENANGQHVPPPLPASLDLPEGRVRRNQLQPVTFVTGRSGAVMIAHAWQGPHKPISAGQVAHGKPEEEEKREVDQTGRGRRKRSEKEREAVAGPSQPQKALPAPLGSGAAWERLGHLREEQNRAAGGELQQRQKQRQKHRQRSLMKVVEKYGLECGPPLNKRLTIHHNRQNEAKKSSLGKPPKKTSLDLEPHEAKKFQESRVTRLSAVAFSTPESKGVESLESALSRTEGSSNADKDNGTTNVSQDSSERTEEAKPLLSDSLREDPRNKDEEAAVLASSAATKSGATTQMDHRGTQGTGGVRMEQEKPDVLSDCEPFTVGAPPKQRVVGSKALACVAGVMLCSAWLHMGGSAVMSNLQSAETLQVWGKAHGHKQGGSDFNSRRLLTSENSAWDKGVSSTWLWFIGSHVKFLQQKQHFVLNDVGRLSDGGTQERRKLEDCGTTSQSLAVRNFGLTLGWASACFYLGSRASQLIQNHQRQSAEGLSMAMFLCAFLANLTYGTAILVRSTSLSELLGKAPWVVGSMGTLSLDISIFLQAQSLRAKAALQSKSSEQTPLLKRVV